MGDSSGGYDPPGWPDGARASAPMIRNVVVGRLRPTEDPARQGGDGAPGWGGRGGSRGAHSSRDAGYEHRGGPGPARRWMELRDHQRLAGRRVLPGLRRGRGAQPAAPGDLREDLSGHREGPDRPRRLTTLRRPGPPAPGSGLRWLAPRDRPAGQPA